MQGTHLGRVRLEEVRLIRSEKNMGILNGAIEGGRRWQELEERNWR